MGQKDPGVLIHLPGFIQRTSPLSTLYLFDVINCNISANFYDIQCSNLFYMGWAEQYDITCILGSYPTMLHPLSILGYEHKGFN